MHQSDAAKYIIELLRNPRSDYSHYGYGMYMTNVIHQYIVDHEEGSPQTHHGNSARAKELSPMFYAAAWDLCRMGVLRPGIKAMGGQATDDGASGNGYSLTPYGEKWIEEVDHLGFLIATPDRFSELVEPYKELIGAGFIQRAYEANRAYYAGAYLAAVAMCGAAAESILIAVAVAKTGDENDVLAKYRSSGGRRKVENLLLGQASAELKRSISSFTELLHYWRDEAAHGTASEISELEAHEALARLLRFAQVVKDRWTDLT